MKRYDGTQVLSARSIQAYSQTFAKRGLDLLIHPGDTVVACNSNRIANRLGV